MNRIFAALIIISSVLMLIFDPKLALPAMSQAGNEAAALSLRLLAVYSVWTGLLQIVEETGLGGKVQKLLYPVIRFIFGKDTPPQAAKCIAINMTANMLGVGGAATPMGIDAIRHLGGQDQTRATLPMIMLLVINSSGLQLLPTTIIGLRQGAGSTAAGSIVPAALIVTAISFVLSIVLCKLCEKLFPHAKRTRRKK